MKKKRIITLVFTFTCMCILCCLADRNPLSVIYSNTEALTQDPEDPTRNFRRATIWYPSNYNSSMSSALSIDVEPTNRAKIGYKISLGCSMTWNSIECCLNGTDMDGCVFAFEDEKCKQIAERSSH